MRKVRFPLGEFVRAKQAKQKSFSRPPFACPTLIRSRFARTDTYDGGTRFSIKIEHDARPH